MTRCLSLAISKKVNLLVCLLFLGTLCSYGQTDSLAIYGEESTEVSEPKKYVDFTPEDVQLQNVFRPTANDYLFPTKWYRRMYFGGGAGLNVISDNVGSAFQPQYFGYVGYKFTPIHSLRGRFTIGNYDIAKTGASVGAFGFGVDYLANLSNFAFGYNPYRRIFDISSVLGVGMMYSSKGLPRKVVPYATLGLRFDAHLSSNIDFFIEPYVGAQASMDGVFGRVTEEKWNLQYGVNAGVQVNFNERFNRYLKADTVYRRPFVDASIGGVVSGRTGGIMHRSGVGYQGAIGMWLNPVLGLRVGLQGQSHHWYSQPKYLQGVKVTENRDQVLLGGRAELMLNPLNISKKWRDKPGGHDFDVNLLAGVDLGGTMRAYVPKSPSNIAFYYGMTGALQFLYRINNPGTYIYIEPRYSTATYDITKTDNSVTSHTNHFLSMNVGTRVYMNQNAFTSRDDDDFEPHWWAGLDFGGVKWQRSKTFTTGGLGINPTFGLNVGYDWKRLASFRAQLSYQRLYYTQEASYTGWTDDNVRKRGYGLWNSAYNLMDLRLSYMMNLSTLLQGYKADRKFNLWWTVGPTFSVVFSENDSYVADQKNPAPELNDIKLSNSKAGKASPGLSTSLMAALRVSPSFDITAEAYGQYNFLSGSNPGNRGRINSAKYGLSIGSRYHFEKGELKGYGNEDYDDFFFDASLGWTSNTLSTLHNGGTVYSAYLGKWFNPLLGMRIGMNGNTLKHETEVRQINGVDLRYAKSMATVGARAEFMVNPLNFFTNWRDKDGGHDFDMNFLVGADLGGIAKNGFGNGRFHGMYYGITTAMQFLYRINNPGTYIYLEPRYLSMRYDAPYEGTKIERTVSDDMLSMSIGVRTYMTSPSFNPSNSDEMESKWWLGADFGGMKIQRSSIYKKDGLGLNPSLSLSVGYDWKPLASFRTQLSYQHYSQYTNTNYSGLTADNNVVKGHGLWERNYNILDWRFAYMFNLNNFFQGYDADRKFNFWLTAGPAVSFIVSENNKWDEGQNGQLKEAEQYRLPNNKGGNVSPALHASFMTTYRISDKVDLTAEALGQYNFIHGTNPGGKPRVNNLKYNFAMGARYYFDQEKVKDFFDGTEMKPWNRGWQLEASYGWAIPTGNGLGMHGSGSSIYMSAGRWISNVLGFRLGFGGQQTYWGKTEYPEVINAQGQTVRRSYTLYKEQLMLGTRLEVMFNPLNLLKSRRDAEVAPKWDLNISMGLACGGMAKVNAAQSGAYVGFTAAMTGLYRVSNTTQLFVEPRIETHNYDSNKSVLGFTQSFTDKMFMVNIGTRITRPVDETKESRREVEPSKMSHRGWWAGVTFGGSKMNQTYKIGTGGLGLNPSFGLTAGYDITRLHGVRAHIAYDIHSRLRPNQRYSMVVNGRTNRYTGTMNSSYQQMDVRLLYMLNMTNLWTGYDKRNKFNVYWELGPTLATVVSDSHSLSGDEFVRGTDFKYLGRKNAGEVSFGLTTGVMMSLSVTDQWDIMAEVLGQYHTNRGYMPEQHFHFLNGVKMNFSLGTRYNF